MNKKTLALMIAAGIFTASAYADPVIDAQFQNHPYISLQAGIGGPDSPSDSQAKSSSINQGVAYRVAAGFMFAMGQSQFQLGPEIGYVGYPDTTYDYITTSDLGPSVKYRGYAIDLLANANFSLSEKFHLIAKAGVASVSQNVSGSLLGQSVSGSADKVFPELAAGIGYNITPVTAINITYNTIIGDNVSTGDVHTLSDKDVASVNTAMIGVVATF